MYSTSFRPTRFDLIDSYLLDRIAQNVSNLYVIFWPTALQTHDVIFTSPALEPSGVEQPERPEQPIASHATNPPTQASSSCEDLVEPLSLLSTSLDLSSQLHSQHSSLASPSAWFLFLAVPSPVYKRQLLPPRSGRVGKASGSRFVCRSKHVCIAQSKEVANLGVDICGPGPPVFSRGH